MKKIILLILPIIFTTSSIFAQEDEESTKKERNWGHVSGNFQADGQYYIKDSKIGAASADEKFLLGGYSNIVYTLGNFSAGVRFEGYMNTLLGYPNAGGINDGVGFPNRWANFRNEMFDITVGNFYEQFGNGLVLRSYDEKMLGIDNAFDGIRIKASPVRGFTIKGLIGKQRNYWEHGDGIVRAVDAELSINELISKLNESDFNAILGGSFVSKFQKEDNPIYNLPNNVAAAAGRIDLSYKRFNLVSEYAYKINDPSFDNNYIYKTGQAFLVNATYTQKGLGIILGTKWVDNMSFRSDRNATLTQLSINLLPEISKNHTYTLPAFYPYSSQTKGEWGAKGEIMYKFAKNTPLGGKYGTSISINYSRAQDIKRNQINDSTPIYQAGTLGYETSFFSIGKELLYQDINIEISKKISSNFNFIVSYVNLTYNYNVLRGKNDHENVNANIGVIDATYKFENGMALKGELQALFTKQDEGNWGFALLEYTIPNWFFTAFDSWNYGNPDKENRQHYYGAGFGFIKGGNRIQLSYGKQKAGVMCIGGVCRSVPATNGVAISISSTF
ncbi:MAG: DUF6029 family protein [Bacteroidales bacterium]|jgi:hypothetical protein|nr:DUF6029 family protein [Bacteroidales bacterium]